VKIEVITSYGDGRESKTVIDPDGQKNKSSKPRPQSKGIFWSDPNEHIQIIESTEEARDAYGYGCGADHIALTDEHLQALRDGKTLAWNDSEYVTFVMLKTD